MFVQNYTLIKNQEVMLPYRIKSLCESKCIDLSRSAAWESDAEKSGGPSQHIILHLACLCSVF